MVHVAFEDAEAYAAWASKALPAEAECGLRDSTKHQSSRSGEMNRRQLFVSAAGASSYAVPRRLVPVEDFQLRPLKSPNISNS